jgi:Zn-finger nucleic acid-binding protein
VNCPACARELTRWTSPALEVDVCDGGCGGIWFDHYELHKVDEPAEAAGEGLLDVAVDPSVQVDLDKRRTCPKCTDGVVMMRHFTSVERKVTIDECPECGGIWLDAGELRAIRTEFPSDDARQAAADKYFDDVVGPELKAEHAKSEAELERSQHVARAFRFITPSYYLPGKQEGGAF